MGVPLLTLVERGGRVRSFHIDGTTSATITAILRTNVRRGSDLNTDTATWCKSIGKEYASHGTVNHTIEEYVRDARAEIALKGIRGKRLTYRWPSGTKVH